MSIDYALIAPHPPIIVPEVGGAEGLKPVEKTVNAMLQVSLEASKTKPEVIIIITPHGPVYPDAVNVRMPDSKKLSGSLWQFRASDVQIDFESANDLAKKIIDSCSQEGIRLIEVEDDNLDHGALVPLYYVAKSLHNKPKLVSMNISLQGYKTHFDIGKVISRVCDEDKRPILFVASGDLSHRLTQDAPAGYNAEGKKFDDKLVSLLKEGDVRRILEMDPFWVDEAGECGLRSICTLLGVVEGRDFGRKLYFYEGPYGVGYLVMGYRKIKN